MNPPVQQGPEQGMQDPKDQQMAQMIDQIMQMCQQLKTLMVSDESQPEDQGAPQGGSPSDFAKQLMQQQGQ